MLKKALAAIGAIVVAAAVVLVVAPSSSTAKAPREFYGVVPQTSLTQTDFQRMGTGKVGTIRVFLNWAGIDQTSDPSAADNNWSSMDPIVLEAAQSGIDVLPFVFGTPEWVAKNLDGHSCSPSQCVLYAPSSQAALDAWQHFLTQTVERYGPNGDFWAAHPEVPKTPIEDYQLWNEQNSKSFFLPKPKPKKYAKLLTAGSQGVRAVDPQANVVLGGMAELAGSKKAIPGSEYLEDLYRVRGVKSHFDGVAPHPYGASITKVSSQVETYRKVMKKAHDSKAGMWVTEVGAGSAKGGTSLNRGSKGQASLLKQIYKYFLKHRKSFHVDQVDWYSWMDSQTALCSWCKTSGLLKGSGAAKPSYKQFTKLTGGNP